MNTAKDVLDTLEKYIHKEKKEIFSKFDKHSNNLELTRGQANDNNSKNLKVLPCSKNDSYFFRNDLQDVACLINNKIGGLIDLLIEHGALKALMTGSGSSVYGIFENHMVQGEAFKSLTKILNSNKKTFVILGNIHASKNKISFNSLEIIPTGYILHNKLKDKIINILFVCENGSFLNIKEKKFEQNFA